MNAMSETLALLQQQLQPLRRIVHEGDAVFTIGQRFERLSVVHAGSVKLVDLSAEGQQRVTGLRLRGDWLGFDGLASGTHACDAIALDTGEIWSFSYDGVMKACVNCPALLAALNTAMSEAIGQQHRRLSALCARRPTAGWRTTCRAWRRRWPSAACAGTASTCACRAPRSASSSG